MNENRFYMAGTQGTGQYIVVALSARGRVGYRPLSNSARVRVEPASQEAAELLAQSLSNWKQPDGQFRFSTVTGSEAALHAALEKALIALGSEGLEVNPDAPDFAKKIVESVHQRQPEIAKSSAPQAVPPITIQVEPAGEAPAEDIPSAQPDAKKKAKLETMEQERERLVAQIRARKLPGANAASRWSLETLRRKLSS